MILFSFLFLFLFNISTVLRCSPHSKRFKVDSNAFGLSSLGFCSRHALLNNVVVPEDQRQIQLGPEKTPYNLSEFCEDALTIILSYLDRKSSVKLRQCNKKLFERHLNIFNREFLQYFQPRIRTGLECFKVNRLISIHLMPFKDHLLSLLNPDFIKDKVSKSVIISTLSETEKKDLEEVAGFLNAVDDFDAFLMIALYFTHQSDPIIFWRLLESCLRANIYNLQDFSYIPEFSVQGAFDAACELELKCLCGNLLLSSHVNELNLIKGCIKCMNKGHINMFTNILRLTVRGNLVSGILITSLLEYAVKSDNYQYISLLFSEYPQLDVIPSKAIFIAIDKHNTNSLGILISHRGLIDLIGVHNESGLNALEFAAAKDFWSGIYMISRFLELNVQEKLEMYTKAVWMAIVSDATTSANCLITEINCRFGLFSQVVPNNTIIRFIIKAIERRNPNVLKILLLNSPRDIFDLQNQGEEAMEYAYNPIYHIIKDNFLAGWSCIINHFSQNYLLNLRDHAGRTPFLLAAYCGNSSLLRIIAMLDPKQISSIDYFGNIIN